MARSAPAPTVPMRGRDDSLAAAAAVIATVERRCGGGPAPPAGSPPGARVCRPASPHPLPPRLPCTRLRAIDDHPQARLPRDAGDCPQRQAVALQHRALLHVHLHVLLNGRRGQRGARNGVGHAHAS
eukprot:362488-Chlamydomonas_euryale.AAC.2